MTPTDVAICIDDVLRRGDESFAATSITVLDARYGALRLTPCDDVIVRCEPIYVEAANVDPGELVEIELDNEPDPGDG
jgi:hypothetical protein